MKFPSWTQTIRFRLTLTYSAVLIALSALLLGGVYLALEQILDPKPLNQIEVKKYYKDAQGELHLKPGQVIQAAELSSVQSAVNYQTLQSLRNYSAAGMAGLFGRYAGSRRPRRRSLRPTCPGGSRWMGRGTSCGTWLTRWTTCSGGW